MIFFIEAIDLKNKKKYIFKESININDLFENLKRNSLTVIDFWELPDFLGIFLMKKNIKLKPEEVIEIIEGISLIIKAGLPINLGLNDLANDSDNEKFKNVLLEISDDITSGRTLTYSFSKYEKSFSPMIINLTKIGEESGKLQETLQRGAFFLKRTLTLKKKVKQALIYPAFAFVTVFAAMLTWLLYVLPQMTEIFKQMDVQLPPLTIFIINLSDIVSNYIHYFFVLLIIIFVFFKLIHSKYYIVRFFTDKFWLNFPVIKNIISGFNMAFISEYLKLSIVSGLPFYSALESLKENLHNEVFKKAIKEALVDVENGHQLSYSFKKTSLFAPFMTRMMSTGEASGTLDAQFGFIAEHYNEKVDYYAENISKIIEPLILIFVGGFMAIIMLGLMGPMYDIVTKVT